MSKRNAEHNASWAAALTLVILALALLDGCFGITGTVRGWMNGN